MEIHKPKPWRGWREFVKEIGTIVIGVLIALGAEQVVERRHWRHEVEGAREDLARDAGVFIAQIGERESQWGCVNREIAALGKVLERAAATNRLDPVAKVNAPPPQTWTNDSYDSIVSGQILPHMGQEERYRVAGVNHILVSLQRARDEEINAWTLLGTMAGGGRKTSDAELANFRAALAVADKQDRLSQRGAAMLLERIKMMRLLTDNQIARLRQNGFDYGSARFACMSANGQQADPTSLPNVTSVPDFLRADPLHP